jgi:hypothetical protein
MTLKFDIEKSLNLCPPQKRVIHDSIKGEIEFVRRIVLDRDKVTYRMCDQIRVLGVVEEDAGDIKVSLETHNFIHTEYPPIIAEDPDREGHYFGKTGFNRNAACEHLGEKQFIYDLYKFKSPKSEFIIKNTSNHNFTPKKSNTKEDLIQQILLAIDTKIIINDDDEIKDLINIIAADKSIKERNNILKGVRGHKTKFSNLKTYHCSKNGGKRSTKEAAKKFNLGWEGDSNLATSGKLGYIPPYPNPVTAFAGAEKLIKKYGFRPIYFTFFIPEPLPEPQLTQQREKHLAIFNKELHKKAEFYQIFLSEFGVYKSIDEILDILPYKVNGFLPQHENPNPLRGGRPTEDTVVDVNGNPVVEEPTNVLKFGT